MYNDYFGFSEPPFNITPNPRFYYRTQSYDEVLEVVQHGIETRKGIMVVVGEAGSGKTLFLKSLVRDLAPKAKTVIVPNPHADLDEMLQLLIERLELRGPLDDRTARLERLTAHLIEERRQARIVCLLIDEAQDLEAHALDELRLLANLEFEGDALLPIVLIGQTELNLKLDHPSAIRIKQRVALTRNIYPLIRQEVGAYIDSRLNVAGYNKSGLFDAEAIDSIAAHSGGIPRIVNAICDNSLLRAYSMRQSVITARIVDQVGRELRIGATLSLQKQIIPAAVESGRHDKSESFSHQPERRSMLFAPDEQEPAALQQSSDFFVLANPDANNGHANKTPQKSRSDARFGMLRSLPSVRIRWYTFAGASVLLLLALNIVNSSQLAGIYSALSGKARTTVADPSTLQSQNSQSIDDLKANRALGGRSTSDKIGTKRGQLDVASSKLGNEIKADDAVSGANSTAGQRIDPAAPPSENGISKTKPADAAAGKKNESRTAVVTLEVVKRSKVRANPNDGSEIIAELEPGDRVSVLAKSRDYYHVRSLDDKTIRGYVHREDAFFEIRNRW